MENLKIKEDIVRYLLRYGKENKYRLARVFKVGTEEVLEALSTLENEGRIEMEGSKAKGIITSRGKELEKEAEKLEEVEPPKEVEESEKGIKQWLANLR